MLRLGHITYRIIRRANYLIFRTFFGNPLEGYAISLSLAQEYLTDEIDRAKKVVQGDEYYISDLITTKKTLDKLLFELTQELSSNIYNDEKN